MNIRDLEYLVAVAEQGHFRKAAESCFVSQPTLSSQIRKLEEHLGVMLIERTNRSVRVTPVGELVVQQAREILRGVGQIEATAQAWRDPRQVPLKVGVIPTVGPYLIPLVLEKLKTVFPALPFTLYEDITAALLHGVRDGSMDAAFIATATQDASMVEIPVYEEPFWVAMPKGHPLALKDKVALGDLEEETLLLLTDGHCFRDQMLAACRTEPGNRSVNTRATSLSTILAFVAGGEGLTLVPALACQGGAAIEAKIDLRPIRSARAKRTIRLVCRKSFSRLSLVREIAAVIGSQLPDGVRAV
jgi:LysR family transcriptional regulator, hydrogen peroxide-inducible genes activator